MNLHNPENVSLETLKNVGKKYGVKIRLLSEEEFSHLRNNSSELDSLQAFNHNYSRLIRGMVGTSLGISYVTDKPKDFFLNKAPKKTTFKAWGIEISRERGISSGQKERVLYINLNTDCFYETRRLARYAKRQFDSKLRPKVVRIEIEAAYR
jgi:hypothetical protein